MADAAVERLINRVTKSGFQLRGELRDGRGFLLPQKIVFWFWIKIGSLLLVHSPLVHAFVKGIMYTHPCTQLLFTQLSYPHLPCPHT
ncbi:hypothetical protein Bca52824_051872 [Brassica carinata]|uniref:Uncharacterized protein n=1 Tax=Brassica carinata TaxID=52824 RepID=A0A8X7UJ54_BRACI|nr:hypothetical protein Bca52824_051872 [Brassica carinata]